MNNRHWRCFGGHLRHHDSELFLDTKGLEMFNAEDVDGLGPPSPLDEHISGKKKHRKSEPPERPDTTWTRG